MAELIEKDMTLLRDQAKKVNKVIQKQDTTKRELYAEGSANTVRGWVKMMLANG